MTESQEIDMGRPGPAMPEPILRVRLELAQQIVSYLEERPYREVSAMIDELRATAQADGVLRG